MRLETKDTHLHKSSKSGVEYIATSLMKKEYHIDSVFPQEFQSQAISLTRTKPICTTTTENARKYVSSMDKDAIVSHHNLGNWVIVPIQLFTLRICKHTREISRSIPEQKKRYRGFKFLLDRYILDMLRSS